MLIFRLPYSCDNWVAELSNNNLPYDPKQPNNRRLKVGILAQTAPNPQNERPLPAAERRRIHFSHLHHQPDSSLNALLTLRQFELELIIQHASCSNAVLRGLLQHVHPPRHDLLVYEQFEIE